MLVTRTELAAIFDTNPMTVTKWGGEGIPIEVQGRPGKASQYDTAKCIRWYVNKKVSKELSKSGGSKSDAIDLYEEQARLTQAKAEAQELKNDIDKGIVAPMSLMTEAIGKQAKVAADILASLKLNLKRQIPDLKNSDLDLIEREIIKVQNAIADMEIEV